jgi:catalase
MAVTFHLPGGSRTDISAQSVPRFPFSTPEAFIEFVRASDRNVGSLWRLPLFVARHPRVLPTLNVVAEGMKPPASYATIPYYAVHAFKWVDSSDGARYVRYRWHPERAESRLARLEARGRGPDYLQEELRERLSRGPIRFSLLLQIAGEEDPVDDPAAVWPEGRESVIAGTLTVTDPQSEDEAGEPIVFDPTRVTDGIEPSNDPVLQFRPRAYSLSAQRRTAAS